MAHSSETTLRHNLPARDYERFVGRHDELAQLRRLLLPYPKSRYHLVTIDGIGGIGKSALALETAWRIVEGRAAAPEAERFAAIVWVSAKRTYLTVEGIEARQQRFGGLGDLYAAVAQVLAFPAITRARAEEQRAIVALAQHSCYKGQGAKFRDENHEHSGGGEFTDSYPCRISAVPRSSDMRSLMMNLGLFLVPILFYHHSSVLCE